MSVTYETTHRGYEINNGKNSGCYTELLDIYIDHLEDMVSKHSRVLQLRFDLRYPADKAKNDLQKDHLSKFVNRLTQDINRGYRLPSAGRKRSSGKIANQPDPDARILLVREQHSKSDNPHVHGLLLVNANAYFYSSGLMKRIERQHKNMLGLDNVNGLVDYCNKSGPSSYILNKNDAGYDEKIQRMTFQGSYPCKARGKENRPKHAWKMIGTRLSKTDTRGSSNE